MWRRFNSRHGMSLIGFLIILHHLLSEDPTSIILAGAHSRLRHIASVTIIIIIRTVLCNQPVFCPKEPHAVLSLQILKEEQNIQKSLLAHSN